MTKLRAVTHQGLMQFCGIDCKMLCDASPLQLDHSGGTPPCDNGQGIELLFICVDSVGTCRLQRIQPPKHKRAAKNDQSTECACHQSDLH